MRKIDTESIIKNGTLKSISGVRKTDIRNFIMSEEAKKLKSKKKKEGEKNV